ncbi:uncharacterized protein LOC124459501 isoform X3 [Xenia sp. Carnegie-2017]|uniref:uncharacterized protein LOC124459501 isoform X3 n=1 Tax=Xenia sp. Carnegie-2017 TaxID=2897299 RepID=UPI001F03AE8B|nr:uncharacterized protein LOC124459501 isoform X3 [Xenia sp. Carnegie-2017]
MKSLAVVVFVLFALAMASSAEGKKEFCDYPGCTCYYYKDPCPKGYYNCSRTKYCTLKTNRPCCYPTEDIKKKQTNEIKEKKFCDYPGCTCYYYKDPCPKGYYDCPKSRYCTLRTNKPCCYPTEDIEKKETKEIEKKKFCDYPGCTCYYYKDPCPKGYYDCPKSRYCTLSTNKPCCYPTEDIEKKETKEIEKKKFCDYPGCTCYYYKDPCPKGYYDCPKSRYCTLRTNKPCCY